MKNDIENYKISIIMCCSIFKRFSKLNPAIAKYKEVLKKANRVVWLAKVVLCRAKFSLNIKSLFIFKLFE